MALGKVKSRKQARRLADRQAAWTKTLANLPGTVNKDGWKKPGSNRK